MKTMLGSGNFHPSHMRPFLNAAGQACVVTNGKIVPVTNALLRYEEWLDLDRTVINAAVDRLVGVSDLISKGLVHNLGSIGLTVSQWDRVSDMDEANISISGITKGAEDTPEFDPQSVAIPIVHKDFRLNLRRLEASRILGESLDVTAGSLAGRLVAEKSEDMLFGGSTVKVGDASIPGYLTHTNRNTVDMSKQWTDATKTGAEILADVQNMLAAARGDNYYGPFTLYIPGEYEGVLDNDYDTTTATGRTIRERLLQLSGIQEIKVVDRLSNHNVILVQLTRDVIDLAKAQDVTTVQWEVEGGMQVRFKTYAVWAPRIKSDFSGKSGIVHMYEIP